MALGLTAPKRVRRLALGIALAGILACACTNSSRGYALAEASCKHVADGLAYFYRESPAISADADASLDTQARTQFALALPLSAKASEDTSQYQGFMTTLQESNRVDIRYLVPALTEQCSAILGHSVTPAGVTTVPPGTPGVPTTLSGAGPG